MADLKFTKSHEWIRIEGDVVTTGITDYAQGQLGDIVFIELPKVGERIKQLSQLGTIESTKAASELYAPISGEVIQANGELGNNPQWINESPLDQGWIAKIKIEDQVELDNLMDEAAYEEFIGKEKK